MAEINERITACISHSGLTKTAFAERINVSQQYISKLARDGVPSDRTIADICREFHVNEEWLRTGTGAMFKEVSRDEQIADFVGEVLSGETDDFRHRFLSALSRMDVADWSLLERMVDRITEERKKD